MRTESEEQHAEYDERHRNDLPRGEALLRVDVTVTEV
jgi:hypothetical protein